jgi:hypothetical protein
VLRADELVHARDARAVSDRDVARVRLRPVDIEQVAVVAEDLADVRGQVEKK